MKGTRLNQKLTRRAVVVLVLLLAAAHGAAAADKDVGPPAEAIVSPYWDERFRPTAAYGSYNSIFRKPDGTLEMWNNTVGDGPKDGLVRFRGTDAVTWTDPQTVVPHDLITDVFEKDGATLAVKRRYTRPSVVFDPTAGYFAIPHVCNDYGPKDGSVYPALLTSADGEAWTYHGRLKGEIEAFMPPRNPRWADGRGLFYQPGKPGKLDDTDPQNNRFLFFSNQYPGSGCLALLYSADGETWKFYRREGEIANLLPMELRDRTMIFPDVVRAGKHGWYAWISEKWPPISVWRIHSADGLNWELFGSKQPEIVKPDDAMIKCVSAWYDDEADVLHGYLAVWENIDEGTQNYRLYHSLTRRFDRPDDGGETPPPK